MTLRFSPLVASAALFLVALTAPAARAQTVPPKAGDRVRVTPTTGRRVEGTLVRMDADSVILHPRSGSDSSAAYSTASLARVDVARGRSRHPLRGALIGFAAGVAAGGLAVATSTCTSSDCSEIDPAVRALVISTGAVAGTVVGTVIGLHGRTRWERVGEGVALTVVPGRGTRVGFSIPTR